VLGVRPEHVRFDEAAGLPGRVVDADYMGTTQIVTIATAHGQLNLAQLGLPGHVAVYMPQSYNVAGNLLLVPADRVEAVDVPTSEIVTFVVSGGISGLGVGYSLPPPPPSNRATSGNVGSN
jgi:hypothetical protein